LDELDGVTSPKCESPVLPTVTKPSENVPAVSPPLTPPLKAPEPSIYNKSPFPNLRINTSILPYEPKDVEDSPASEEGSIPLVDTPSLRPPLPKLTIDIAAANRLLTTFISPNIHSPDYIDTTSGSIENSCEGNNEKIHVSESSLDLLLSHQTQRESSPIKDLDLITPKRKSSVESNSSLFQSNPPQTNHSSLTVIVEESGSWSKSVAFETVSTMMQKVSKPNSLSPSVFEMAPNSGRSSNLSDSVKVSNKYNLLDIKVSM
jgi:hypothetical protein